MQSTALFSILINNPNSDLHVNPSISHRLAIIDELTGGLPAGAALLDFGCGDGSEVIEWRSRGFQAMGCDVAQYSDSVECQSLYRQGVLRLIGHDPYRIPFDDHTFDALVSNQVFEHVNDYAAAIQETRRVLKPGGIALHLFPPRWKPIEAHVNVPFAGVWRSPTWLRLWAQLGVRNEFQRGLDAGQVAKLNFDYLRDHTNYLSAAELRREFERHFSTVHFVEDVYLRHSPSRNGRALYRLQKFVPLVRVAYSSFRERALVAIAT
jgi:SAM-dependent methyltransferase